MCLIRGLSLNVQPKYLNSFTSSISLPFQFHWFSSLLHSFFFVFSTFTSRFFFHTNVLLLYYESYGVVYEWPMICKKFGVMILLISLFVLLEQNVVKYIRKYVNYSHNGRSKKLCYYYSSKKVNPQGHAIAICKWGTILAYRNDIE
jgi:hypothetical protein